MTTPTNWPNPERPGVPPAPFDQRPYLDHVLRRKSDNKLVDVRFFPCGESGAGDWCFGNMNRINEREAAERFHYHTPVLTLTQIAEMLAGERERCLAACESSKVPVDGWGDPIDDGDADRNEGIDDAMAAIRNLGAAS